MIRFEQVRKRLGRKTVLDGVDYEIKKSEIFIIVGLSGAGKSVSLKHMVRLLTPDSGRVWVGDDVISEAKGRDLERIRARFGYLFQSGALLQWMSAGENVGLPLREHTRKGDEEIDRIAREKLALVQLDEAYDKSPADLSGGMRKRVGLARAIAIEPEIILYDEPSTGLDPLARRSLRALLAELARGGTTVLLTTHLFDEAEEASRIGILDRGRLVALGTPAELKRDVGGDVLVLAAATEEEAARLAADVSGALGPGPGRIAAVGATVRVERPDGPALVPALAASFAGRFRSLTLGAPSLEDVFVDRTGHAFDAPGDGAEAA